MSTDPYETHLSVLSDCIKQIECLRAPGTLRGK